MCIQEIDGLVPLKDIAFTKEPFWVQAHDMPMACMTKEGRVELLSGMEKVYEVEIDAKGCGWGSVLRAKVGVDITIPLIQGRFLIVDKIRRWIPFKYARLPSFCFACGSIKHTLYCSSTSRYNKQEECNQYGLWLKATSSKSIGSEAQRYRGEMNQNNHHNK